jgi:hypothetical protein
VLPHLAQTVVSLTRLDSKNVQGLARNREATAPLPRYFVGQFHISILKLLKRMVEQKLPNETPKNGGGDRQRGALKSTDWVSLIPCSGRP